MFAIERFQLEEEDSGPAAASQEQQQQRQQRAKAAATNNGNKRAREGSSQQQGQGQQEQQSQSKLLAEHLARVKARREARAQEQGEGGEEKTKKKKRPRGVGDVVSPGAAGAGGAAGGVKRGKGKPQQEQEEEEEEPLSVEERRRRKKEKKAARRERRMVAPVDEEEEEMEVEVEMELGPEEGASPDAAAAPAAAEEQEPEPELKRSSGLDAVRRLLSGHMLKGGRGPPAPVVAPPPPAAEGVPPAKGAGPAKATVDRRRGEEDDGALSVAAAGEKWGLDPRLAPALEAQGIERFFAVQCRVLPYLVSTAEAELVRDTVVCAPTGSGKTLVYVLALLQGLRERRVVRLRGLVVVPNRDLAIQVMAELQRYAPSVGLKAGLAIGQTDFAREQRALVWPEHTTTTDDDDDDDEEEEDDQDENGTDAPSPAASDALPLLLHRRGRQSRPSNSSSDQSSSSSSSSWRGGRSRVDILVATPGRLMDHMERTPGFTLQHLRFLVLDEVDRLVNQSYQNWAPRVQEAAHGQTPGAVALSAGPSGEDQGGQYTLRPTTVRIRPQTQRESARLPFLPPGPLRKLLFSATFTADPQKAAMLDLRNPRYFSVTGAMSEGETPAAALAALAASAKSRRQQGQRGALLVEENEELALEGGGAVSTPATLQEEYLVCESREKPLVLLALLLRELQAAATTTPGQKGGVVLIFTSSLDSTHRLCRLLQLHGLLAPTNPNPSDRNANPNPGGVEKGVGAVREFSSSLSQPQRAELIRRCLAPGQGGDSDVRVLVSSDGMARGIDLPNVAAVVNYDVPTQAKTYVHRVGRTARAGRAGRALSLVMKGQEAQFARMRAAVDARRVGRSSLQRLGELDSLQPGYQRALRALKAVLARERQGKLRPAEPLSREAHRALLEALLASSTGVGVGAGDGGEGDEGMGGGE